VKVNEIEKRKKIDEIINRIYKKRIELGILDEEDLQESGYLAYAKIEYAELYEKEDTQRAGRLIEVGE